MWGKSAWIFDLPTNLALSRFTVPFGENLSGYLISPSPPGVFTPGVMYPDGRNFFKGKWGRPRTSASGIAVPFLRLTRYDYHIPFFQESN